MNTKDNLIMIYFFLAIVAFSTGILGGTAIFKGIQSISDDVDRRPALKSARYQEMDAFIANNPIPGAGDVTVWVYRDRETGREIFVTNTGSVVIGDAAYTTSLQEVVQP